MFIGIGLPVVGMRRAAQSIEQRIAAKAFLFLDPASLSGLSDSDPIASWPDSSPNGSDAMQASSGKQPVYDTSDGPPSAYFNGSKCLTVPLDMSDGDSVTVVAAIRKEVDTAARALLELSATTSGGNNGVFGLFAPIMVGNGSYQGRSGGTVIPSATATGYTAPHVAVITLKADISSDILVLRVNGVEAATASGDQGSGNYGNYTLNIGARNDGASLGFVGNLYGLIIHKGIADDRTLALYENWARSKAGIPTNDLVAWGDSFMTRNNGGGTYPQQIADALGVSVANFGIGGQTSAQITARQGAIQTALTVTGNSIPTSGAVSVTAITNRLLSTPATTVVTRTLTGYLNGVHGTLECVESGDGDASDAYSFTRTTTSGSTTSSPAASPFYPDVRHTQRINLIAIGRNDVGNLSDIQSRIAAIVASLGHNKYLVIGVTNASTEPSGSAGHTQVVALNNALAATYGARFVDIRTFAIEEGLAAAGITPSAQDLTDIANDVPPDSLRDDNLHPDAPWLELIAAQCVERIRTVL